MFVVAVAAVVIYLAVGARVLFLPGGGVEGKKEWIKVFSAI